MSKVVLISCGSKKAPYKTKAKNLYKGTLFKYSLLYAKLLKPDKIFVLSALHGLLSLNDYVKPYNVTLSSVSGKHKQTGVKVLSRTQAKEWGGHVIGQLKRQYDLKNDKFVLLAGESYLKHIRNELDNADEPLKGLKQGERMRFLKNQIIKLKQWK